MSQHDEMIDRNSIHTALAMECGGIYNFASHPAAVITLEKLQELQDKARKYDAMQVKLDEHPYSPPREDWRNFSRELPKPQPLKCAAHQRDSHGTCVRCGEQQVAFNPRPAAEGVLYGIESKGTLLKGVMIDATPKPLTFEMMQNMLKRGRIGGGLNPSQMVPPPPLRISEAAESGPGLRAQGGKYTEPGHVKIYCDNGDD